MRLDRYQKTATGASPPTFFQGLPQNIQLYTEWLTGGEHNGWVLTAVVQIIGFLRMSERRYRACLSWIVPVAATLPQPQTLQIPRCSHTKSQSRGTLTPCRAEFRTTASTLESALAEHPPVTTAGPTASTSCSQQCTVAGEELLNGSSSRGNRIVNCTALST